MKIELFAELTEGVDTRICIRLKRTKHFLQGDHVRFELRNHESRAGNIGLGPTIDALPSMNIVSRYANGVGHNHRGYRSSGAHYEA